MIINGEKNNRTLVHDNNTLSPMFKFFSHVLFYGWPVSCIITVNLALGLFVFLSLVYTCIPCVILMMCL